jgi:hypothetical protein
MFTEQDYKNLDHNAHFDLLADQTAKYTRSLVQGAPGHNLNYYRTLINIISEEIRLRQFGSNNQAQMQSQDLTQTQTSGKG